MKKEMTGEKPEAGHPFGLRTITRRELLGLMAALGCASERAPAGQPLFSEAEDQFLEELEHANFLYFWEQANPQTGLVRDRFTVRGKDRGGVCSIAATGFGLTALCIGGAAGLRIAPAGTRPRAGNVAISLEATAASSGLLPSLRRYEHRRTPVGL